jgi:hypothetical protein
MCLGIANAAGEVSTSREVGVGHWITVSGIIRDEIFTGTSSAHASSRNTCFYAFEMALGRRRWRRSTVGTGAYPERCWTGGEMNPAVIRELSRLQLL